MLEYAAIAEAQRDCPSIQAAGDSSLSLQLVPFGTLRVLCDNKSHHLRPVILLGHRRQVVDAFHGIAHPGARATNRIMGQRVTWSCMNKDVTQCVKDCQTCSRAKVTWQAAAALQPISVLRQRFSHIHVDIVGLLWSPEKGSATCSQLSTGPAGCWRRYLSSTLRRRPAGTPSSASGWLVSACRPTSLLTRAPSSLLRCGRGSATSSACTTTPPLLTTRRATVWSRGPTGASRCTQGLHGRR